MGVIMKKIIILIISIVTFVAGCDAPTKNIDVINDNGTPVMGLDYRDFDIAASKMVQSMLSSGAIDKPGGGRYVVAGGRVVNDTMQRIDTDQLMVKIQQELLGSGKVVMTSAVGSEQQRDELVHKTRELRDSDEFNRDTVAAKGTLIAPELSISGKIFQRNLPYQKGQQQVEYYFQLRVSEITSGLRLWENEVLIGKRGSNKSVTR
jgi:penicillin-binding protein activator